jgi:hypothetical protein
MSAGATPFDARPAIVSLDVSRHEVPGRSFGQGGRLRGFGRGSYSVDVNVLLYASAILFQHGVRTLYANDRDFRKFKSLDVRDPFS